MNGRRIRILGSPSSPDRRSSKRHYLAGMTALPPPHATNEKTRKNESATTTNFRTGSRCFMIDFLVLILNFSFSPWNRVKRIHFTMVRFAFFKRYKDSLLLSMTAKMTTFQRVEFNETEGKSRDEMTARRKGATAFTL